MSITANVAGILRDAQQEILQAVQFEEEPWTAVFDADGNPVAPSEERTMLVFLCGDREMFAERPNDAGYGLRLGHFDLDRQCWMVGGRPEPYVTHWMETPPIPATD